MQPEDATGSWNQTSIDAMKRFQASQNIESNGKTAWTQPVFANQNRER